MAHLVGRVGRLITNMPLSVLILPLVNRASLAGDSEAEYDNG